MEERKGAEVNRYRLSEKSLGVGHVELKIEGVGAPNPNSIRRVEYSGVLGYLWDCLPSVMMTILRDRSGVT